MDKNEQNHPWYEWIQMKKSSIPWMDEWKSQNHPTNQSHCKNFGGFLMEQTSLFIFFTGDISPTYEIQK